MKPSGRRRRRGSSARARTRFAVDAMHGSLARKLRALGFDSSYYRSGGDDTMLALARTERRIIISSDRSLVASAVSKGVPAIMLKGRSDGARLREISVRAANLGIELARGDPRCSICDGELHALQKESAIDLVPPSVAARHRLFYRCTSCGQVYWRGGHWKKLRSLARQLEEK